LPIRMAHFQRDVRPARARRITVDRSRTIYGDSCTAPADPGAARSGQEQARRPPEATMAARSGARRRAACPRFAGRTLMVSTRPRACARSVLLPRWRKRTRSGSILRLCSKLPGPAAHKHAKSPHRSHRYRPHRAHPHHHGIKKKNILSTVFVNSSAARGSSQIPPYP